MDFSTKNTWPKHSNYAPSSAWYWDFMLANWAILVCALYRGRMRPILDYFLFKHTISDLRQNISSGQTVWFYLWSWSVYCPFLGLILLQKSPGVEVRNKNIKVNSLALFWVWVWCSLDSFLLNESVTNSLVGVIHLFLIIFLGFSLWGPFLAWIKLSKMGDRHNSAFLWFGY